MSKTDSPARSMPLPIFLSPPQVNELRLRDLSVVLHLNMPDECDPATLKPGMVLPVKEMHLESGEVYRGNLQSSVVLGVAHVASPPILARVAEVELGQDKGARLRLQFVRTGGRG